MDISSEKSGHRGEGDDELLTRYAAGDDRAFGVLVRRHLPLVLSVTRRRLGNSGLAEDAAQEVFIDLSRRAKTRRAIACLPAWLHRAATYEAATAARTESRHRHRVARAMKEEQGTTADPALDRMLDEALASLPERDRVLLVLHHYERLSYEAIARKLGTTAAAAQRRGHRALEKLAGKVKLAGRDEAACAAWLTAGIHDPDTDVPAALAGKISATGKAVAFSLPWLSLAAATLVLAGAGVGAWGLATPSPKLAATTPPTLPSKSTRLAPAPRKTPAPEDELDPDVREFIARAREDSADAWAWVQQRPVGANRFLRDASHILAARDLAAAERLLEVIKGDEVRPIVIEAIADERALGNFQSAVIWMDALTEARDRDVGRHLRCSYTSSEHLDHDYVGALGIARSPEVRNWLIRQTCEKAAAIDETRMQTLADELHGEERRMVQTQLALRLLERRDPGALSVLDEARPTGSMFTGNLSEIALAGPEPLLDWMAGQDSSADYRSTIQSLWHNWCRNDAEAAAAWARSYNAANHPGQSPLFAMDPVVESLMSEP